MKKPDFIENGYPLSTDYEKLWELIKQGHRIAGWVYIELYNIWVVAEIKYLDSFFIGSHGVGYSTSNNDNFENFIFNCKNCHLHYIPIQQK